MSKHETMAKAVSLLLEEVLILGSKADDLELENGFLRYEIEKIKKEGAQTIVKITPTEEFVINAFVKNITTNGHLYKTIKTVCSDVVKKECTCKE